MSDKEDDDSSTENDQDQELFTTLALRVHAANLPRHGVRQALPDTYAVVTSAIGRKSQSGPQASKGNDHVIRKIEWGRTEVVRKESHPQWTRTFELDYEYGSECYFLVEVRRIVNKKIESLGNAVCEVSDILGSKNHTKVKRLPKGGVVFCRIEAIREENTECIFRFRFAAKGLILGHRKLKSLSPFSHAPDTIVQISKRHPNAARLTWVTVYRSAPVENSFDPVWDIGEIDLESVCNANFDQPLRIAVLMSRKNARNVLIGECETTLRMILNTQADSTSALKDDSFHGFRLQRSMEKTKRVGFLQIQMAQVIDIVADKQLVIPLDNHMSVQDLKAAPKSQDPYAVDIASFPSPIAAPSSFQDYVKNGWKLDLCVAIDFTSSNGDPRVAGTLHDQNPMTLNDFEETIVSIGNAIEPYRNGLGSTVWGFGCKFGGVVRHLFQCGPDSEVFGVDGILQAYKSVFESDLTMSGPTLFDQVIQAAAVRARKHQQSQDQRYSILLIITDGISPAMEETKRKLNVYSTVPLSIIFVGVGRNDFGAMYQLCSPTSTIRSTTTFVEFRQHQHDPTSLGRTALSQVPTQVVQYMMQNGIEP